ncbi:STM3941 family protein [Paenibacillus aurantiacus]|uniref:STM3941 family protein n=1 Tax=Paenibacillus aurantiacus TaxID=1936118 RepID=A0ABV5KVP6_9BACL
MHRADDERSVALYPAKAKTGSLTLAAALFVATGCSMIASDEVLIRLFGLLCVLFFGGCFIYLAYRMFNRQPSLLIDDEGVTDNSSYVGGGRLAWQDIVSIQLYDFMGQRMIGLTLRDPRALYDRQGRFKRLLLKANKGLVHAQVNIPQSALAIPLEQVYDMLLERWHLHVEPELPGDEEEEEEEEDGSGDEEEKYR